MRMTVVKIKDRTGILEHRCLEGSHYVTILTPWPSQNPVILRYQAGFLTCGDFQMASYMQAVELVCGPIGMAKAIEALPVIGAVL